MKHIAMAIGLTTYYLDQHEDAGTPRTPRAGRAARRRRSRR
ncbi:MAG: hypothetical protein ACRDP6_33445 [Actinoallomurus sp.]